MISKLILKSKVKVHMKLMKSEKKK